MLRNLAIAFAIVLVPVMASAGQVERKDVEIFKDVAKQVEQYPRFTVFDDVQVAVDQGVVTLTGDVTMPYKRDDIGRRVAEVPGVKSVQNKINVLPVSQYDDELRYEIARAIYGNPAFWNYAAMVNPPIHIIVDGGRVTLTGVVNSNVERMLARSIASSFGAFSVTNDIKTDAEMRAALAKLN
jgi:hyperosmotically inducible protein